MSPEPAAGRMASAGRAVAAAEPTVSGSLPVFYINRDRDVARLDSIRTYLSAAGLAAERVTAVEGLAVPDQFRDYFFTGGTLHSKLKPGEVGCYASHLLVMSRIVERDLDYALVLEDDAVVRPDICETIANVLSAVPEGWDLVHICKDSNRAVKTIAVLDGNRRLIRYSRVPETTTGYLISRSGAKKFLKHSKRYWPVDTDFRRPWSFGLEIYGVMPRLIDAGGFPSAIHQLGNHSRLRRGIPMLRQRSWAPNPLHTPEGVLFNLRKLGPFTWGICAIHNSTRRIVRIFGLRKLARRLGLEEIGIRIAESLAVR